MGNYETLLRGYYAQEESILRDAKDRLAASKNQAQMQEALEAATGRIRAWIVETLQVQDQRLGELETALRETRNALGSAQERMEGMERENAEASAVLLRLKSESSGPGVTRPPDATRDLRRRLEEQEELLKRRESEIFSLRKQFTESQTELDQLVQRLKIQETAHAGPPVPPSPESLVLPPIVPAADAAEIERLRQSAQEAQERAKDLESARARLRELEASQARLEQGLKDAGEEVRWRQTELETLRLQLRETEKARDALEERLKQMQAQRMVTEAERVGSPGGAKDAELAMLRERLNELEGQLRSRSPELDVLQRQLKEGEAFRAGLIQRIQALESARARAAAEAQQSKAAAAPSVQEERDKRKWMIEKEELEERMTVMSGDLANLRRAHENSERAWVETLSRQDTMRLRQIADLKAEIEKLRAGSGRQGPGSPPAS